jgi:hypothetical protein
MPIVLFVVISTSCNQQEQSYTALFNGENLENWDVFLGSSLGGDFDSLAAAATTDNVFSLVELDGENVIRISGEINGSLATREEFENYHLRLVFKWGDEVHSRRNSGLLYHSFGDFGAAFGTWMANIELQLMHQSLGDTYLMLNTTCETAVKLDPESNEFIFDAEADELRFGENDNGRLIRKNSDHEKPLGQWNVVDLYCFGTTAVHVVNGETVMVNNNMGTYENGEIKPLTKGKIQIQSEGAELFVKLVEISSIDKLPQ